MSNQSETLYLSTNLAERFAAVRQFTETLCETLRPEDCCIQSMPNSSPVRWHLAHTTWFFETFLLKTDSNYRSYDEHYEVLFNSYYNSVGEQFPRALRGMLTRPTVAEVYDYRHEVDRLVTKWFGEGQIDADQQLAKVVELGLHHEQQHQELILTDVKHMLLVESLAAHIPRWISSLLPAIRQQSASGSISTKDSIRSVQSAKVLPTTTKDRDTMCSWSRML